MEREMRLRRSWGVDAVKCPSELLPEVVRLAARVTARRGKAAALTADNVDVDVRGSSASSVSSGVVADAPRQMFQDMRKGIEWQV